MFIVGDKIVTAMESRWRGANGEVRGEAGDEYARRCNCLRLRKQRVGGIVELSSSSMADIERQNEAHDT